MLLSILCVSIWDTVYHGVVPHINTYACIHVCAYTCTYSSILEWLVECSSSRVHVYVQVLLLYCNIAISRDSSTRVRTEYVYSIHAIAILHEAVVLRPDFAGDEGNTRVPSQVRVKAFFHLYIETCKRCKTWKISSWIKISSIKDFTILPTIYNIPVLPLGPIHSSLYQYGQTWHSMLLQISIF